MCFLSPAHANSDLNGADTDQQDGKIGSNRRLSSPGHMGSPVLRQPTGESTNIPLSWSQKLRVARRCVATQAIHWPVSRGRPTCCMGLMLLPTDCGIGEVLPKSKVRGRSGHIVGPAPRVGSIAATAGGAASDTAFVRRQGQACELADLALVDRRLEGEVEVLEGALEPEMRAPRPDDQIPLTTGGRLAASSTADQLVAPSTSTLVQKLVKMRSRLR
jgi:hypothetical protein